MLLPLLPLLLLAALAALRAFPVELMAVVAALQLVWAYPFWWLWRFARRVRGFRTIENDRVVLHYEFGLDRHRDLRLLLRWCREDHDRLARLFRFTLRRPPVIYLFRHNRDIAQLFGPQYGATALGPPTAVVLADDMNVSETLRHEIVHLFAARWGVGAPPLLSEGLAVWLQETEFGENIDAAARPWVCESKLKLDSLLDIRFFFAEPHRHACYLLAGSFTGFLLRRFGWPAYRRLYRMCDGSRFRAKLEKCFGVSLQEAERQWRHEVLAMSPWCRQAGTIGGSWEERFTSSR